MKSLYLSGVDPLRWREIRERVAAIESYIALERPTEAQRIEHAKRLGLGQTQFLGLVRAWRAHGTAVALAGATRQRAPRSQWRALPEQTERIMSETLDQLGPDVPLSQATKAVADALSVVGLKTPSKHTIWRRLMAIRAARGSAAGAGDVIIAKVRLGLPTVVDGKTILPSLVLAVDPSVGRIIAWVFGTEQNSLDPIADVLQRLGASTVVVAEAGLLEGLAGLSIDLRIVTSTSARRILGRIMGKRLGSLQLLYAAAAGDAAGRLTAKSDRAVSTDDAVVIIQDAILRHNASRPA